MPESPERLRLIEERLRSVFDPLEMALTDESALHAGHEGAAGGGSHFRLRLVSRKFEGIPKVARHRLVYDALDDLMKRDIHALAMTLQSPEEATGDAAF